MSPHYVCLQKECQNHHYQDIYLQPKAHHSQNHNHLSLPLHAIYKEALHQLQDLEKTQPNSTIQKANTLQSQNTLQQIEQIIITLNHLIGELQSYVKTVENQVKNWSLENHEKNRNKLLRQLKSFIQDDLSDLNSHKNKKNLQQFKENFSQISKYFKFKSVIDGDLEIMHKKFKGPQQIETKKNTLQLDPITIEIKKNFLKNTLFSDLSKTSQSMQESTEKITAELQQIEKKITQINQKYNKESKEIEKLSSNSNTSLSQESYKQQQQKDLPLQSLNEYNVKLEQRSSSTSNDLLINHSSSNSPAYLHLTTTTHDETINHDHIINNNKKKKLAKNYMPQVDFNSEQYELMKFNKLYICSIPQCKAPLPTSPEFFKFFKENLQCIIRQKQFCSSCKDFQKCEECNKDYRDIDTSDLVGCMVCYRFFHKKCQLNKKRAIISDTNQFFCQDCKQCRICRKLTLILLPKKSISNNELMSSLELFKQNINYMNTGKTLCSDCIKQFNKKFKSNDFCYECCLPSDLDMEPKDYIECDYCQKWFHIDCIGMKQRQFCVQKNNCSKYQCRSCELKSEFQGTISSI